MEKKINKKLIGLSVAIFAALVLFVVLAILVAVDHVFWLDKFNVAVANKRNGFWTGFFKTFTHLGSFITLAVLALISAVLLWFVAKNKRMSVFSLVCFLFIALSNFVLKRIIRRHRPYHLMIIEEGGYSFPSGHSMMIFAFFALVIYFVYKSIKNKWLKWGLIALCSLIIAMIGFSRIYLGVHYLTDVIAGFSISFVLVGIFVLLYNSKLFPQLKD